MTEPTPNLLEHLPADLPDELFDTLVDAPNVTIERIVSRGHTSPRTGWYDQDRNEWVLVLQGAGTLQFADGSEHTLHAGDHLVIEAHRCHRVSWTDPDTETVWLAVHY